MKLPLCNFWGLLVGAPLIAALTVLQTFLYYPRLLDSGQLPVDGDSIAIPMYYALWAAPVLTVVLGLWAAPALYNLEQCPRLFAWRWKRPLRSILGTLFYGGAAVWMVWDMVQIIVQAKYAFELLLLITTVPLLLWNIALQAVCVDGRSEPEAYTSAS